MDSAQYVITINADGTGAVQALDAVNGSFAKLVETSNKVKATFGEPFQHAGIYLFSRQLLDTVGLGALAQHAFMAINLAVTGVIDAFGLAAGPVAAVLLGLGALATIYKEHESLSKKVAEASKKEAEAQRHLAEHYDSLLVSITKYQKIVGSLPQDLQNLQSATQAAMITTAQQQSHQLGLQMKALQDLQAAEQSKIETDRASIAALEASRNANKLMGDQINTQNPLINQYRQEIDELTNKIKQQSQAVAEAKSTIIGLAGGHATLASRMKDVGRQEQVHERLLAYLREEETALDKVSHAHLKAINAEEQADTRAMHLRDQQLTQLEHYFGVQTSEENQFLALSGKVAQGFSSAFSNAFAQTLVEGKKFTDAFKDEFKHMAEAIIADIVRMIVEMEIFNSLMSFGLGGGGGLLGGLLGGGRPNPLGPSGVPGYANYASLGPSANFAMGGDFLVDQPTLIGVGEGGETERVSISPLSQGGGGGGGSGTTIGSVEVNLHVHGVSDPREIAEQTAPYLIDIIRGRGNLSFTGPNIG